MSQPTGTLPARCGDVGVQAGRAPFAIIVQPRLGARPAGRGKHSDGQHNASNRAPAKTAFTHAHVFDSRVLSISTGSLFRASGKAHPRSVEGALPANLRCESGSAARLCRPFNHILGRWLGSD